MDVLNLEWIPNPIAPDVLFRATAHLCCQVTDDGVYQVATLIFDPQRQAQCRLPEVPSDGLQRIQLACSRPHAKSIVSTSRPRICYEKKKRCCRPESVSRHATTMREQVLDRNVRE